jgi:hypothetical protein
MPIKHGAAYGLSRQADWALLCAVRLGHGLAEAGDGRRRRRPAAQRARIADREAIAVTAGLAIVIGHNVWSGGALLVIVTLLGWIILIRGVVLLFLSPSAKIRFSRCSALRTCSISMPGSRSFSAFI